MSDRFSRGVAALEKGLTLFLSILDDHQAASLATLAARAGIPKSTAQRMVGAFVRGGLLSRVGPGRYAAGLRLGGVASVTDRGMLARTSRPFLKKLARDLESTVHLGVLEGDMVTYLVKEHGGGPALLTQEMMQLEAYCSGIGKILLAYLDDPALDAYLDAGPFVALTDNTITDPAALRSELRIIRERGVSIDNAELEDGLYCIAVPVRGSRDLVRAAISASSRSDRSGDASRLDKLTACAAQIGARLRRDTGQGL